eukprot:COSAG06_NODE_13061_length_1299_cov_3.085977_1_plen_107_part_00
MAQSNKCVCVCVCVCVCFRTVLELGNDRAVRHSLMCTSGRVQNAIFSAEGFPLCVFVLSVCLFVPSLSWQKWWRLVLSCPHLHRLPLVTLWDGGAYERERNHVQLA